MHDLFVNLKHLYFQTKGYLLWIQEQELVLKIHTLLTLLEISNLCPLYLYYQIGFILLMGHKISQLIRLLYFFLNQKVPLLQ